MNVADINRAALRLYLADQPTDRRHPEQLAREWRDGRVTEAVKARYRQQIIAAVDAIDDMNIGTDRDSALARAEARAADIVKAAEAQAEKTITDAGATVTDIMQLRSDLDAALADAEALRRQLLDADRQIARLQRQVADHKDRPVFEPALRRSGVRWYLAAGGTAICEAPAFAPPYARPMFVEVAR